MLVTMLQNAICGVHPQILLQSSGMQVPELVCLSQSPGLAAHNIDLG